MRVCRWNASNRKQFDVLAVDAFSGDAIPVHLLTRQAFALYWRHLKPDGVLAVHVSNRYLSLAPGVALAAAETGKQAMLVSIDEDDEKEIARLRLGAGQFAAGVLRSARNQRLRLQRLPRSRA